MRGEERVDAGDGGADGGLVGAEDLAEQPVGHAEAVVAGGGGDDGLEGELPGGGGAAVPGAGAPRARCSRWSRAACQGAAAAASRAPRSAMPARAARAGRSGPGGGSGSGGAGRTV